MEKSITDKEAAQTLEQVKSAQAEISRRTAKEYVPWIGWGLFIVLLWPPFDFLNPNKWGVATWTASIIGTIITSIYFATRKAKIKSNKRSPKLAWLYYILWIIVGSTFAVLTHTRFHYAWTVAGLVTGLPFILYGLKLKNQA